MTSWGTSCDFKSALLSIVQFPCLKDKELSPPVALKLLKYLWSQFTEHL